ncbi:MAG TPA: TA system VapC family ribonuclease toxin [Bryobacteraceae bacterium]|nr:TA system VapC family ribonuclease toxin [Bryobacteraceae bacterium]
MEDALSGTESVGLAWNVLLGFLRLTTRSAVMTRPLFVDQALAIVGHWLAQPVVAIIEPGPRHFELLSGLLSTLGTAGNLTSDAHLAALAMEHEAEVYSADFDFARFSAVRWRNPLAME